MDVCWSNSFDLLFCGLEFVIGGQWLYCYQDYVLVFVFCGEELFVYVDYLFVFVYGMLLYGGFVIGLECWVVRFFEVVNVCEVMLFLCDLYCFVFQWLCDVGKGVYCVFFGCQVLM